MHTSPKLGCPLDSCRRSLADGDFRSLGDQVETLGDDHAWEAWVRRSLRRVARPDGQELLWGILTLSLVLITYALSL